MRRLNKLKAPVLFEVFEEVVLGFLDVTRDVDKNKFLSPYSLIPLLEQFLGLKDILPQHKTSPYSAVSIGLNIDKEKKAFKKKLSLNRDDKIQILDEIYDMIAPVLLEEDEAYIEHVMNTRYKGFPADVSRDVLKHKLEVVKKLITKTDNAKIDFAHIIHYAYYEDICREFGFLPEFSPEDRELWSAGSFPVVFEVVLKAFKDNGEDLSGWIIFVANSTEELIMSNKLRKHKILQAALLAKRGGVSVVGMGGLIASFARGGQWLSEQVPDVGFTTGHAYTVGNIVEIMKQAADEVNTSIEGSTIAIVGGAGSVGSGVAKMLMEYSPGKLILVDLNSFGVERHIDDIRGYYAANGCDTDIDFLYDINSVRAADFIVVATSSTKSLLQAEQLKPGVIIVDDSFPKNVSKNVLDERDDILLLEGGITQLPVSVESCAARQLPAFEKISLEQAATAKKVYSCFAETLLLGYYGIKEDYGLGRADVRLAGDMMKKSEDAGFSRAPLQCFDEIVSEERIMRIRQMNEKTEVLERE